MKLLGEKELEVNILRDLVKKVSRLEIALHWVSEGYAASTVVDSVKCPILSRPGLFVFAHLLD